MNNTPELSSSNPNLKDMIQLTLPFPSDIRRCDKNYFRRGLGVSQSEPNWHTFSPFSGIQAHKSARLVRKGREKRCLQYSYGRAASVNEKQWMFFLNGNKAELPSALFYTTIDVHVLVLPIIIISRCCCCSSKQWR